MGVLRNKIWRDLWENKGRTAQVVLIIAMGAFAVGMIIGSNNLISAGMAESWATSAPAMINLSTEEEGVDDDVIEALRGIRGLEDVEGYQQTTIEWRLSPEDEWQPAGFIARDDYDEQTYAKLELISGEWPTDKIFAVEQGSEATFGITQGSQLQIRVNDKVRTIRVSGEIYNPTGQPPSFGGNVSFYTTRDRYGDLTGNHDFNRIAAGAAEYDEEALTLLADEMQDRLEKLDINSGGMFPGRVSDPTRHFFQDILDGIFLVLGIMAVLTLLLGSLLVYNTINALITQQTDQIGMMKAVGGQFGQIARLYFTVVIAYGLLALLVAVPLGALGAYGMYVFMLTAFNVTPSAFILSTEAVLAQVAICLLTPLLVSLLPVISGARITVREAISTYGLDAGTSRFGRWLASLKQLSRVLLLTLNNTFRNKWRLILTQVTLVGSGLIFMMVMSVRDSVSYTFGEQLFSVLRFNVALSFEDNERIHEIEAITLAHPQVEAVEMWGIYGGTIRLAGQPETNDDEGMSVFGVPLPTKLYGPQLREGRWLEPGDTYVVVLNQALAEDAGIGVGDRVTLTMGFEGEAEWTVVGLISDPIISESVHAPRETLLRVMNDVGKASTVWIQTVRKDAAGEAQAAQDLRDYYASRGIDVSPSSPFGRDTASEITDQILNNFGIIISLFAVLSVVMGLVGAITLSGVLSLSVLERRREIGVMRAIGATSWTIIRIFVGEGLMLGLISWLIALPLSIPAGYLMAQGLGAALDGEITFSYTPTGALLWLAIIVVLSIVASWFPARGATRISVRESLAYQ